MEEIFLGAYLIIMLVVFGFSLLFSLAVYLCTGFSIMKISNKLSIKNGFFGFIPFLSSYKLGEIAECCSFRKGFNKKYAKLLVALNVATSALSIIYAIAMICFMAVSHSFRESEIMFVFMAILIFSVILMIAVVITYMVFFYIALYRIYNYFEEKNATLFIVLSILFSIAYPILLLIIALKKQTPQFEGFNQFSPQSQVEFQSFENQNTTQE